MWDMATKWNINQSSHPNGYLCNFVFRYKRRRKGRPSGWILACFRGELSKVVSVFDKSKKIYSGSKLEKIPWVVKVTLILPVYAIA